MLNSPAFVDSLSAIIQMGLLYPAKNNNEIQQLLSGLENAGMHLSKREIDVLRFLIAVKQPEKSQPYSDYQNARLNIMSKT